MMHLGQLTVQTMIHTCSIIFSVGQRLKKELYCNILIMSQSLVVNKAISQKSYFKSMRSQPAQSLF